MIIKKLEYNVLLNSECVGEKTISYKKEKENTYFVEKINTLYFMMESKVLVDKDGTLLMLEKTYKSGANTNFNKLVRFKQNSFKTEDNLEVYFQDSILPFEFLISNKDNFINLNKSICIDIMNKKIVSILYDELLDCEYRILKPVNAIIKYKDDRLIHYEDLQTSFIFSLNE